jgi:hypothetical protein
MQLTHAQYIFYKPNQSPLRLLDMGKSLICQGIDRTTCKGINPLWEPIADAMLEKKRKKISDSLLCPIAAPCLILI